MRTDDSIRAPESYERSGDVEDTSYAGIQWQCPRCRTSMDGLRCLVCGFDMEVKRGIVEALPPERSVRFLQFIRDYEHIRAAEGRGSQNEEYYLGLPYRDATGRNNVQWKIRARSYKCLVRRVLKPLGRGAAILDLGAGNCWMSYRLALAGYRPVAVDLLTNHHDGLGAAEHYYRHLSYPFPRFQAEATRLPFLSDQFDAVVFNASFHYAEDYETTLREALRCLKPGGMVVISDTPWYSSEESGRQMVAERHTAFLARYGTASDSIKSREFLTEERLRRLEERLLIRWDVYLPWHGIRWALRPWIAKFNGRREPSQFRIYVARKNA